MTLASILVVDADIAARTRIVAGLKEAGHSVSEAESAASALRAVRTRTPDLMVCDCGLPDLAGIELLSDVRRSDHLKAVRVLMTSDGERSNDAVLSFESGADDFLGKPIDLPELLARVAACLWRPANLGSSEPISVGGITIDDIDRRVVVDGEYLTLAPREFQLLQFLLGNRDRVFSRRQLLVHVWDRDASVGPRTVDVHVRRLRSVLEPYSYDRYLQTVRGSGYRFSLDG